jgi:hypothetical protein
MKYLLQRPLPDELLSSALVRTCRRFDLPIGGLTRGLTGSRKWAPGFFQGSHLAHFGGPMGLAPVELLWRHTVFPYATAFMDKPVFEAALSHALATGVVAKQAGATTQSVSDMVPFRRLCLQCVREDRKTWGVSYWHRAHNLPGVLVCSIHGRVLRETSLSTTGSGAWRYELPHELTSIRMLRAKPTDFDVALSHHSVALLSRLRHKQVARTSSWYREQLVSLGLLSPNRLVNAKQLVSWVSRKVGEVVTRYGFKDAEANLKWLALMVRPANDIPFIPLKHLLFETALASTSQSEHTLLDHVPTGRSKQPRKQLDAKLAMRLSILLKQYLREGKRVRVSDALSEAGCWHSFRHDRGDFPLLKRNVLKLRRSKASLRPVRNRI